MKVTLLILTNGNVTSNGNVFIINL